jgi:hypothetical protein
MVDDQLRGDWLSMRTAAVVALDSTSCFGGREAFSEDYFRIVNPCARHTSHA